MVSLTKRAILLAAAFTCISAGAAPAQGSPYVPLDDVAYTYIDALIARGYLAQLPVFDRPYTSGAILAAADSATGEQSAAIASYFTALRRAVSKYRVIRPDSDSTSFHATTSGNLYVTGQTSGRRELMLADDNNAVKPAGTIKVMMSGGPISASMRVLIDSRLNADPEFTGRKDRKLAARAEDGYVRGQWKYGELSFGRVGRNWGPPGVNGLMLGSYAYTYDHLYAKLGTDQVNVTSIVAKLDTYQPANSVAYQRYLSLQRLSFGRGPWHVGLMESFVYSGEGRGFEPTLSNPFNILALSWRDEKADGNLALGGEASWHSATMGNWYVQGLLDDFQIDKCDTTCKEPASFGVMASVDGLPLPADQRGFASYVRVSNLAYRTPNPAEKYASADIGLGQPFSDFDELKAGLDLAVIPRIPVRVYGAFRRQGEGDYRKAFPPVATYAKVPLILSGVVMHVKRIGASGGAQLGEFELSGDAGMNWTSNAGHVAGVSKTSFEGRIKISWDPSWRFSL